MPDPRPGEPSSAASSAAVGLSIDTTRRRAPHQRGEADLTPTDYDKPKVNEMASASWSLRNRWIVLAMASGACAAFNGVFAKLTTNDLTTTIAQAVKGVLGLSELEGVIEVVVRALFFGLNLIFNGVMWTLFTQALANGSSTTRVSIMNTSTNFFVTAILGFMIFSETLPPLWWAGATLLVAGNVIIGRKDDVDKTDEHGGNDSSTELGRLESDCRDYDRKASPSIRMQGDGEDVAFIGETNSST